MKKIISLLLTLVMVFSVAAMPSAMAVSDVPASVHATLQVDRIKKYGNLMLDASIQDFLNAGY